MNRAPRTATSMTALPTRSSIMVKPAARSGVEVVEVLTARAPLTGDDRRDQRFRAVLIGVRQQLRSGGNAELLGRIDVDEDLERIVGDAELRDPAIVVRPV